MLVRLAAGLRVGEQLLPFTAMLTGEKNLVPYSVILRKHMSDSVQQSSFNRTIAILQSGSRQFPRAHPCSQ